jgi:hypothetical protein
MTQLALAIPQRKQRPGISERFADFGDPRLPEKFWSKCAPEPNSGCWLWHAAHIETGYGKFLYAGRLWFTHRLAYTLLVDEIEEGLVIDHLCRTTCCVNPAHLEPVTNKVNMERGAIAMRTHCPSGHPYDQTNTYEYRGNRQCRVCREVRRAESRQRHPRLTRAESFTLFQERNPHVLDTLLTLARARMNGGSRYISVKSLWEELRVWTRVNRDGEFKLNNNHTASAARWLIAKEPRLAEVIRLRGCQR